MILFINACVRQESRTKKLAERLLSQQNEPYEEVQLEKIQYPVVDEKFLLRRDRLIQEGDFNDPIFSLAKQFANADEIVIAAPYWDLSFPASMKQYLEQINVIGITFRYTSDGVPEGLCKAGKLTYITTAGGDYVPEEYGFGYIKALAESFYGIRDVRLLKATGLDMIGADEETILQTAFDAYKQ